MADLPSLNAVRMFEIAAQCQSFTQAAERLHVTQGAVSKQIALLEEQLGCSLFKRHGPKLVLTDKGRDYLAAVEDSFAILRRATTSLRRRRDNFLTISLLPSFARFWLLPRIPNLERTLPHITVRLAASYRYIDFDKEADIDVAIRFGKGHWPEVFRHQLTFDPLFPVCAPSVAASIQSPADLLQQELITDFPDYYNEWPAWFTARGIDHHKKPRWQYDDTGLQIQAAVDGRGVLLARDSFIGDYLNSGALQKVSTEGFLSQFQYYFVCPEARLREPSVQAFFQWISTQSGDEVANSLDQQNNAQ